MVEFIKLSLNINMRKVVLSSVTTAHKTENFIKQTNNFVRIDLFLSQLLQGVIASFAEIRQFIKQHSQAESSRICFKLETTDKIHSFYFRFGNGILQDSADDIVFFKYVDKSNHAVKNDMRLANIMRLNDNIVVFLKSEMLVTNNAEYKKIYNLSNENDINFPLLNEQQRKIVETEDQNILVQGTAGSGKTNLCIDKIIFSACRGYSGKVMYSTFSRGLLIDTKKRVMAFKHNLDTFVSDYERGNIIFADNNHQKAIEKTLGIYLAETDTAKIIYKIKQIINFLQNNVQYALLEDLNTEYIGAQTIASESDFINNYIGNIKNHQLTKRLEKISNLSYEVVYREIYGLIFGSYDMDNPSDMLSQAQYALSREGSFSALECETIYFIAKDYAEFLSANNMTDNNFISRKLLAESDCIEKFSLVILDEAQDMTEVNLCFMKSIARKMFCVGDALQMINPAYFSFAYLKRLMFDKDIVTVSALKHNYRNTARIAEIVDKLSALNIEQFGTHSFVLKSEKVDTGAESKTLYLKAQGFSGMIASINLDGYTVIVASDKEKTELRKQLKTQEILTVSEIKGLERPTVVLFNILSSNASKWQALMRTQINRKRADENSVYRYYFNLFYVALSRAKNNIFVIEEKEVPQFSKFLNGEFNCLTANDTIKTLKEVAVKNLLDLDEMVARISQFISLGQYDNARFTATKVVDDTIRAEQEAKIDINEQLVAHGKYREAGIKFWEKGMLDDAKTQFKLSQDDALCDLVDACVGNNGKGLDADIIRFLPEVYQQDTARELIMQVLSEDLIEIRNLQKNTAQKLKKARR